MQLFSTLASLALFVSAASAAASYGAISPTTDHLITYDTAKYKDTRAFAAAFRQGCITYNELFFEHHQMDCSIEQPGPTIWVKCGGILKNPLTGKFTKGSHVFDHTAGLLEFFDAKVVSGPVSPAKCQTYKAAHPKEHVVC